MPDLPELKHLSHGKLWSAFRKPCTLPYNTKQDNHARDTSRKSTLPLGQQKQTYRQHRGQTHLGHPPRNCMRDCCTPIPAFQSSISAHVCRRHATKFSKCRPGTTAACKRPGIHVLGFTAQASRFLPQRYRPLSAWGFHRSALSPDEPCTLAFSTTQVRKGVSVLAHMNLQTSSQRQPRAHGTQHGHSAVRMVKQLLSRELTDAWQDLREQLHLRHCRHIGS